MDDKAIVVLRTLPLLIWETLQEEVEIFLDRDLTGSIVLSLNYNEGELLTFDIEGKKHKRVMH